MNQPTSTKPSDVRVYLEAIQKEFLQKAFPRNSFYTSSTNGGPVETYLSRADICSVKIMDDAGDYGLLAPALRQAAYDRFDMQTMRYLRNVLPALTESVWRSPITSVRIDDEHVCVAACGVRGSFYASGNYPDRVHATLWAKEELRGESDAAFVTLVSPSYDGEKKAEIIRFSGSEDGIKRVFHCAAKLFADQAGLPAKTCDFQLLPGSVVMPWTPERLVHRFDFMENPRKVLPSKPARVRSASPAAGAETAEA